MSMSTTPECRALWYTVWTATAHVGLASECTLSLSSCEVGCDLGSTVTHLEVTGRRFELRRSSGMSALEHT